MTDLPQGPALLLLESSALRSFRGDQQKGHFFSNSPLPQIIPLGLSKDQHSQAAVENAESGYFPFNDAGQPESDVAFAAEVTVQNRSELAKFRIERFAVLRQLADRLQPLNVHLQKHSKCVVSKA